MWLGNCCFFWVTAQLKQELSNMRASMFELGHAGNCFQQGIIFWNLLPTWGQDISASPVPFDGWIAETMWREDLSLWGVSSDLVWVLVCHLLCFGLAVMSFCLPHVVLCPLIRNTLCCKLKNKGRVAAASSYSQMSRVNNFSFPEKRPHIYPSHQKWKHLQPHSLLYLWSFSHCSKWCVFLYCRNSAVVDPSCVSFISVHMIITWNRL